MGSWKSVASDDEIDHIISEQKIEVEVEFKYDAEQPDELSINIGDVIKNVIMSEGGWWEGELNGKKGMFPDNFVKVLKKEEKVEHRQPKTVQASKRQSVKDLANKIKDQVHEGPVPTRKKDPNIRKKRAKVVYSYEPENDDEIRLEVGDYVDVLKQEEEGWWEGTVEVKGHTGMFPSNFVELVEDEGSDEKEEPKENDTNIIKGKKVVGVGLGNIFEGGQIKLRPAVGGSNKKPVGAEREKRPDKPPEEPMVRKPKDDSEHHIEEETLLPQDFTDKDAYFPQPFIDNSDSYPHILLNDGTAAALEEISDSCVQMAKSGLGSELLSQTDSESEIIDLDISEVTDLETKASKLGNEKKNGADVKTEATSDNVTGKQYSDFYHGVPYIDSASVIMSQLNLGRESQGRMTGEGLVNEDDLIEYEDVNINPDFDEAISLSTSNSDIDQNNQNTRQVQFRNHIQNSPANKNQNEITDMSHDLACILDDLDTHLNQNQFLDSCLESPNKANWESPDTVQPKYYDIMRKNMAVLPDTKEKRDSYPQLAKMSEAVDGCISEKVTSKPNDQTGLIGEHKTPQFKGVFSEAIDSIYVTKKRTLHDAEIASVRTPEFTPLRPGHFDHVSRSVESEADTNSHSRKPTRKSVSFSPINQASVKAKPEKNLPKQGLSALPGSSPKTYFASLEKSGHLSPFIKSIAQKYGLFHSTVTSNNIQQIDNPMETDFDLDESYASTLLGKSGELEDTTFDNSFYENAAVCEKIKEQEDIGRKENLKETAATNKGKVESMINNYLYDVLECESDEPHSSPENEILNKSVNQFVDKVISESCTAVEAEVISSQDGDKNSSRSLVSDHEPQSDSQDHDSELSDLEFYSDSVLLCITHGSDEDSPPLSNCSPSLYPSRIEPVLPDVSGSPCKKPHSTVVTQKENEFSQFTGKTYQIEEDKICKFKPVERPPTSSTFLLNNNKDEDGILSYMRSASALDSKLPDSRSVLQTSSFCRIPFGENTAPSFWFKKDTRESPKEKKTWQPKTERKAKSPGKRSFSDFYEASTTEIVYQVPSLTKLAEKVHLAFFKQRLDAIGRSLNSIIGKRLNSETADKNASYPGISERSPAKKRRRKQDTKPYHFLTESNNSALSPVEEGSVEIYFTSLLDHASDKDNFFVSSRANSGSQEPLKSQKESNHRSKVDWSKALFGSKSHIQKYTGGSPYPAEWPFVRDCEPFVREKRSQERHLTGSPFVSPFKSDRHFRQRPVRYSGSSPFVDDLSEKRKRRKFRPKVNVNEAPEPVTLTSFCRLHNKDSPDFCEDGITLNESRERVGLHTAAAIYRNDDSLCLDGFEKCSYKKIICPGKYHLDSTAVNDQNDEQKPLLPVVAEEMFDSSIGSGAFRSFTEGNISTKTIYSENDLCNSSDLSENPSFQQEKIRQESIHTAEVYGNKKMHKSFMSDNASSLSMFYNSGTDEIDESLSEISQNDVEICDKDLCKILQSPEKACNISQNHDKDVTGIDDTMKKVQLAESSLISGVVGSQCEMMAADQTDVSKKIEAVEEAVKNHLDTSYDSEGNVLNIMKTRGALYEAIGNLVELCSDALEESNSAAVEACNLRVDDDEDGSEGETKNDWDISPDPDTLLRDLENIDLSDTPQYVNKNTDEEIKQFLDNVLQPFDDILTDSFNSVSESPIHRTSTKDEEIDDGLPSLYATASKDCMNTKEYSFNHLNESPIRSSNTEGVETDDRRSGMCDAAAEDLISAEESVLNRSFIEEEQSADTSDGTQVEFGLKNTSSTPIADVFSPSKESVSPQENKLDELIKFSDTDDESFVSALSSKPKQCDNSKNTSDSFESYQTGIDRSSILCWSEEDTIDANSDLESFFQSLSESSAEKTCIGQAELPNRKEDPLISDFKFHTDYAQSKGTCSGEELAEVTDSGAGDCLIDMENIQLNLLDDSGKSVENHCSVEEGSGNNISCQTFTPNNAHQSCMTTNVHHSITDNTHQAMTDNAHQALMTDNAHQALMTDDVHQALMTEVSHQALMMDDSPRSFMTDNFHHAFLTNNAHPGLLRIDENSVLSETPHAAMPYFDGYSPEMVSSSEIKDGSPDSKPACFYVGSSQESDDSSSEVEL